MRKAYILLYVGLWVAVLPYLGFSYFWKDIFFTISGLAVMYVSYLLYKEYKAKETKEDKNITYDNFSENNSLENHPDDAVN